jgi:hypothetical protein
MSDTSQQAARVAEANDMIDSHPVTVCGECHQASCWQGILMCESSRNAATVELCVGDLIVLELEHPTYWFKDPGTGAVDQALFARFREKYPEEV